MCLVLAALGGFARAQVQDVPPDHWAYAAVNDLADKGYVRGYPDGNFLGDRTLTRYEYATIIKRILDELEERLAAAEGREPPPDEAGAAGVSEEDLAEIARLVEEFKVELAVIGTRLDKLEATVSRLESLVERLEHVSAETEDDVKKVRKDVREMRKIEIGGYIQARYVDAENDEDKIDDEPGEFVVRRARVGVTARPTERAEVSLSLDLAKNETEVKNAHIRYALSKTPEAGPNLYFGQMKWPFGYEVTRSSSKRETPERALVFRRLFPGQRDQGVKLTAGEDSSFFWQIGVFNGTGTNGDSYHDENNHKDIVVDFQAGAGNFDFGASGYFGEGVWDSGFSNQIDGVDRVRYGVNARCDIRNLTLKAEYVRGKGVDEASGGWDQGRWASGYYGQAEYDLNTENTLVVRYSSMSDDPQYPGYGRRDSWDFGWIRDLDDRTRLKLFFKKNQEEFFEFDNDEFITELMTKY